MKLGYFTMPLHPMERDYAETLREDRETILLAETLGYVEAFIGEHVTDACETITSCLIFIASLAATTSRIRLGSATVNLPNAHPAAVASQVAMVDTMLAGRFLFGISQGGLLSDAEMFGNLDNDRGPHPPILVTVTAPFSKGVIAAAERGWDPISANFLQPNWVASHWPMYRQGCESAGRKAEAANWRVAKSIFVADDEATAKRYAKSAGGPYGYYFNNLFRKISSSGRAELFKRDRAMPNAAVTLDYILDTLVIAGTADSVVEQILAFRETTGAFGTLLYAGHDWADPALARRSMELMATRVMPAVNRVIGERD